MKRWTKIAAWLFAVMMTFGTTSTMTACADQPIDLALSTDSVKLLGRITVTDDGIEPHSTGAGMAFYATCSGDITLKMTGTPTKFDSLYIAAYVDGELHRIEFKGSINHSSTEELLIATDLEKGRHRIEIVRETEENYGQYIWESLTLNGEIAPMEKSPLLIEFVGDSITAGYASYPETEESVGLSVEHPAYEAGVKSYAYLTAQALGADFQSVCASGYGVVNGYNNDMVTVPILYEYAGYYHDATDAGRWAFERPADVVVINLGSNDAARGTTPEQMETGAKAFMESVRAHNPDASIVWVTGETCLKYEHQLSAAVSALGGAEKGYYFTVLPEGTSGGAGHPNLEEHAQTGEVLTQFLKENVLSAEDLAALSAYTKAQQSNSRSLFTAMGIIGGAILLAVAAVVWVLIKKKNAAI